MKPPLLTPAAVRWTVPVVAEPATTTDHPIAGLDTDASATETAGSGAVRRTCANWSRRG